MIISFISALFLSSFVGDDVVDSTKVVALDEVSVYSNIKEIGTLRQQPASSSHISTTRLMAAGDNGLKTIGTMAPNFFLPDYGSKQTSAIYMRGIGSRIGTPAVGLYVDNVAYYDKTAFDFSFFDVESVDVLRGPQSTLYGCNTMGGLIKVHTFNPFYHNGTYLRIGAATADVHRSVSLSHYQKLTDKFAFSVGGFYDGSNGFFRNDFTGKKVDASNSGGGRVRAIWKTTKQLTLDFNVGYEYSDEGAYPYYYTGALNGEEQYADCIGKITSNLESRYWRGLLNASINAEYKTEAVTLNSITAYQNIKDRMFMDQDFLKSDIFSLTQKQRINNISEELLLKNNGVKRWNWIVGVNIYHQHQKIKAPVAFRKDGVAWLSDVINENANRHMPSIEMGNMTMNLHLADTLRGAMLIGVNDINNVTAAALFHQSTFNDLFGVKGLTASLGFRVELEDMSMNLDAGYFIEDYSCNLYGMLMPMNRRIDMVNFRNQFEMKEYFYHRAKSFSHVLPKASLMYSFSRGNVYATVSRGYRSGGYNVQGINDYMRSLVQSDLMRGLVQSTIPVIDEQKMIPADKKEEIKQTLNRLAENRPMLDVLYKPEYAWNYEVGTHLDFLDRALTADLSAFLIDVSDLQLSKMSENGLGRIITNAGRSRSIGMELSLRANPVRALRLGAAYGLTHSTFRKYSIYDDVEKEDVDCRGNHVPFVPTNTLNVDAAYTFNLKNNVLRSITIAADCSYVGKIYWDELNKYSQSSYSLLNAQLMLGFKHFNVQLWGRNLTDAKYNTFWFESMNRGFEQHGKPVQFGATISAKF